MADGKVCSKCGEWKPFVGGFYRNAASPDGYYSQCKTCRKPISKAYREIPANKDREKARLAKAYLDNREALLVKRRIRWITNKDHEIAKREELLAQPGKRDEQRARCRAWAKNHPLEMRAIVHKRRAAKLGAEGSYNTSDIQRLYDEQEGRCVYCQSSLDTYHVDHIHPLSKGGSNSPDNLQLTCDLCNRMKGAKTDWVFDKERYERLRASQ